MAANSPLPLSGKIFISVSDEHKKKRRRCKSFADLGFELSRRRHGERLEKAGLKVRRTLKLLEGRPNVIDLSRTRKSVRHQHAQRRSAARDEIKSARRRFIRTRRLPRR